VRRRRTTWAFYRGGEGASRHNDAERKNKYAEEKREVPRMSANCNKQEKEGKSHKGLRHRDKYRRSHGPPEIGETGFGG